MKSTLKLKPAITSNCLLLLVIILIASSCTSSGRTTEPDDAALDVRNQAVTEPGTIDPYNPNFSREIAYKESLMMNILMFSSGDGVMLLGRGIAWDYEFLIDTGALPIILANRYTGEDLINTPEYNPGDIYWHVDREDGSFFLYEYLGELDKKFQPDAVPYGERWIVDGTDDRTETDGKTLYTVFEGPYEPDFISEMDFVDPGGFREKFRMPAGDVERTRMFLLHKTMRVCMLNAGRILTSVPENIDGYISLMGRMNPVAWTNPYTNQPMKEVPWVNTPAYNMTLKCGEDSQCNSVVGAGAIPESELIGNYSYAIIPSDIADEMEACLQFYFKMPDGSVASYFSIGPGPLERAMRDETTGEIIDGMIREGQGR